MPNSSSITFISVIAATESQLATVAVDAVCICSSGMSGNTTWKQFISRSLVSSMRFCSPQLADLMIQRGTLRLEQRARQHKLRLRLLTHYAGKELTRRSVLRGRSKIKLHRADARVLEQHLQRLVLDAARKSAAAHDPRINVQPLALDTSSENRDRP